MFIAASSINGPNLHFSTSMISLSLSSGNFAINSNASRSISIYSDSL
nr:MAG TPA: hypothetical protein [Caudoviricetes sp.]